MAELATSNREIALIALNLFRGIERATAEAASSIAALLEEDVSEEAPAVKGVWQRKIARLPGLSVEHGMTAGEVAREVEYDEANTYTVLAALEKSGLLELIPGSPKRWRLAVKHRRDRILRASRVTRRGEWTTYGDVAIAVADNVRLARTVGRVAAKNAAFSNPHRVLNKGGVVPPEWKDDDGRGPEECERRLREENVPFEEDGRAAPSARIGWEEIKARLAELDDQDDIGLSAAA
jgi:alkylated DNA nucleotide flippase Atl1